MALYWLLLLLHFHRLLRPHLSFSLFLSLNSLSGRRALRALPVYFSFYAYLSLFSSLFLHPLPPPVGTFASVHRHPSFHLRHPPPLHRAASFIRPCPSGRSCWPGLSSLRSRTPTHLVTVASATRNHQDPRSSLPRISERTAPLSSSNHPPSSICFFISLSLSLYPSRLYVVRLCSSLSLFSSLASLWRTDQVRL